MTEVFCKITLNKIMPSVRAALSDRLLELGLTQEVAAKKLGLTQPAISQYNKRLRGSMRMKLSQNKAMSKYIDELAQGIIKENIDVNTKVCNICKTARKTRAIELAKDEQFLCLLEMSAESRR